MHWVAYDIRYNLNKGKVKRHQLVSFSLATSLCSYVQVLVDFPINILSITSTNSPSQSFVAYSEQWTCGIQLCSSYVDLYRITLDYRIHYKYNGWAGQASNTRWDWSINSNQISFHATDCIRSGLNWMIIALLDMDMPGSHVNYEIATSPYTIYVHICMYIQ